MLLSQKNKGYKRNSRTWNVRRVLPVLLGALCGLVLAFVVQSAFASPKPRPPAIPQASGSHFIGLAWTYSQGTDPGTGFNIYRSTTTGGPYAKLTASPLAINVLTYNDSTGTGNTKYFYVVTAIDSTGVESANSNEIFATFVSSSPNAPAGLTAVAH